MTKRERSKATAEKRANTALRALHRLGDLSGPGYDLAADAIEQMFGRLTAEVQKQRARFTEQTEFKFGGDDDAGGKTDD